MKESRGRHTKNESRAEAWQRRAFTVWTVIGCAVLAVAFLYLCGMLWQAVATTVVAILVAFMFHVPVAWMETKKIPRPLGAGICMAGLAAVVVIGVLAILPTAIYEIGNLISAIPGYASDAQAFFENWSMYGAFGMSGEQISSAIDAASKWAAEQGALVMADMAGGIVGGVMDFGTGVVICCIAFICAFWLLVDLPTIVDEIRVVVPEHRRDDLEVLSNAFGTAVYGWMKTTIACASITGIACFIVLLAFGAPYAALVALLCGLLYIVPYVGPVAATVLAALVGFVVSPGVGIAVAIAVVIIVNVVANVLAPRMMENSVNMHPMLVLIVIMIGGSLCGIWGMLLAIPVAAAFQGIFITYFESRTGREIASEDGALFRKAADPEDVEDNDNDGNSTEKPLKVENEKPGA